MTQYNSLNVKLSNSQLNQLKSATGTTTLLISNAEMDDLIKIVKSLEDNGLLLKGVTKTVQNEIKAQKDGFLSILLGTLGASLLRNLLTGKGVNKKGNWIHRTGESVIRAGYGKKKNLILSHPLTNFEIQEYYQNELRFNDVYSKDNLPNKMKYGAYVINLDEYTDIGTHCVALHVKNNDVTYFDSSGMEHIPNEIKKFIGRKNLIVNIFRIQAYDSIMCGYFCIGFISFILKGKL